jgi:hypothetical protein
MGIKIETDVVDVLAPGEPAHFVPGMKFNLRVPGGIGAPRQLLPQFPWKQAWQQALGPHSNRGKEYVEQARFIEGREHGADVRIAGGM